MTSVGNTAGALKAAIKRGRSAAVGQREDGVSSQQLSLCCAQR